ncbi:MAG: DNA polymerase Y family protein, partial [Siculibacillus sp.]|nr:DNA polymerase Y family protein [Siculibacillus sp.]
MLALFLPRLATDRLHRRAKGASWLSSAPSADEPPLAVFARAGNAFRLEAVDERAAEAGLAVGQPLAEARARLPALVLVERDAAGEAETLAAIADWCDRFTPLVGLDHGFDGEAGLLLDVTGAAHLFGGEAAMVEEVVTRLAGNGFTARAAIAGTAAAARAVVRAGLD